MSIPKFLRGSVAGALASAALAGFNYLSDEAAAPLEPVLNGELCHYPWRFGQITYQVAGPEVGEPLLFVHSIHAAASTYEFRKNFDFFAEQGYRVYAPDLLGFGLSERPTIDYDDELYIALISDFTRDVIAAPTVVIASSLGCSYVIPAAVRYPKRFSKLVLIAPVGLEQLRGPAPVLGEFLDSFVRSPVLGEGFFNLLTSPPSMRLFLGRQGYHDESLVTEEMIEYHYSASHQPNARFAPAAFVSGKLGRDLRDEWPQVRQPILMAWGRFATTVPAKNGTEFLRLNPRAVVNGYDTAQLPHDEAAERFNRDTLAWLEGRRKD